MDAKYAINAAHTEIREAFDTSDPSRLLAVLDEGFISHIDGRRSGYGEGGKARLAQYLQEVFERYQARLIPIIIEIKLLGDVALDYGWHELTLTPKTGGEPLFIRTRYVNIWRTTPSGQWKLLTFMDNADVPDQVAATNVA